MNQMIVTESNRPVYPHPQHDCHDNTRTRPRSSLPTTQARLHCHQAIRSATTTHTSQTSHSKTAPLVPSTWTRCPSAQNNGDLQIPRDQGDRNFCPICHPREELRPPLGTPRRCRMPPKMLRTSLSILSNETKCLILEGGPRAGESNQNPNLNALGYLWENGIP